MLTTASEIENWYKLNRNKMTSRGVWFLGGEPNTMLPDLFTSSTIRILIVRLSQYSDVAAGITHSYLYQMASSIENCFVDMAFLPPTYDEKLMIEGEIPLLTGTTTKRPANDFDIIAISNSVLQELVNLPALLHHSNIPLTNLERTSNNSPLILIGGSNAYNLSILFGEGTDNSIVDGVFIGDGEKVFPKAIEIIRDNLKTDRKQTFKILRENIQGFYDPSCYVEHFDKNKLLTKITPVNEAPYPVKSHKINTSAITEGFRKGPILYDEKTAGSSHVILSSGCPSFCSFCKESWEQKPYRERTLDDSMEDSLALKANLGLNEISLMTFNANTYSHIFELLDKLDSLFDRVSIKSQRFDAIVKMPALLERQIKAGKKNFTCAMEGVSQRMRALLQKNLDEPVLLDGLGLLFNNGIKQLKVFLILTGYENDDDVNEFKHFLDKAKLLLSNNRFKPRITFSFACLFRPPHTPMQFLPKRASADEMKISLDNFSKIIKSAGFESRISAGPYDALVSEFIAYADGRSTKFLIEASVNIKYRYRGEIPKELYDFWKKKLNSNNLNLICDSNEKNENTPFPWDAVDVGVSKKFLFENFKSISNGKEILSCIAKPWGTGICSGCGACPEPEIMDIVSKLGPSTLVRPSQEQSKRTTTIQALVKIPERWSLCGREFIKAAVANRLMLVYPELQMSFLKIDSISPELFSHGLSVVSILINPNCKETSFHIPEDQNSENIVFVRVKQHGNNKKDSLFPVRAAIKFEKNTPDNTISKNVDQILTKYKIKHQKQWNGKILNWTVNKGQAKKSGFQSIEWHQDCCSLKLTILKWPDIHLINKFSLGNSLEIIDLKFN